jgi:hypothetical protein
VFSECFQESEKQLAYLLASEQKQQQQQEITAIQPPEEKRSETPNDRIKQTPQTPIQPHHQVVEPTPTSDVEESEDEGDAVQYWDCSTSPELIRIEDTLQELRGVLTRLESKCDSTASSLQRIETLLRDQIQSQKQGLLPGTLPLPEPQQPLPNWLQATFCVVLPMATIAMFEFYKLTLKKRR